MTQQKRHPAGSQCCSLIGERLTAMSQDWQGKYGTVTQSFCVPVQSFKSQQRLTHADHPSTLQTRILPSSSLSCVPSSDPRYDDGERCTLPSSGAAMWKTEPMRRKNRRKAARSSGMRSNCIISHRWW